MADPSSRSRRSRRHAIVACAALIVLSAAGVLFWRHSRVEPAHAALAQQAAVPVTVDVATTRDVPIYFSGLGIVQASNTTALHSQVDGKLQSVNFVEGQTVHQGDVLIQIDPRFYQAALDQAKAKKGQDEALLVSAQKDLERFQTLVAKNAETVQNLDHQVALVGQVKATIAADQAAVESAQTQFDYTTIKAPTDGRMGIRQIDPGNIVHAADTAPIVILTQTKPISVIFTLPEKNLDDVRQAMARGAVSVVTYDQDDNKPLATGTLMLVDNEIDQTTGTIKLKASFPNADEKLWSGEFVHARVLIDTRKGVLTVPSAAIQRGPQGYFVWRIQPDNTAQAQPVQAGAPQGDLTVVDDGLSAGDRIVVNGQYRLQAGTRVDAGPVKAKTAS
jgi:multidrug efflux system membrane fusion protein